MQARFKGVRRQRWLAFALILVPISITTDAVSASDPLGDRWTTTGPDIADFSVEQTVEGTRLVITLAEDVPEDLYGFIDLDTDRSAASGRRPLTDFAGPYQAGIGSDLYLALDSLEDGAIDLRRTGSGEVVARVEATLDGAMLTAFLPAEHAPQAPFAALVVGTNDEPTDAAPNGGFVTAPSAPQSGDVALLDNRYNVKVTWRDFADNSGVGNLVQASDDSALYWFFGPDNWELLVKVLNGCGVNGHVWVFAAATTNIELRLEVHDSVSGATRVYQNALGTVAEPINDTEAFSTCP